MKRMMIGLITAMLAGCMRIPESLQMPRRSQVNLFGYTSNEAFWWIADEEMIDRFYACAAQAEYVDMELEFLPEESRGGINVYWADEPEGFFEPDRVTVFCFIGFYERDGTRYIVLPETGVYSSPDTLDEWLADVELQPCAFVIPAGKDGFTPE